MKFGTLLMISLLGGAPLVTVAMEAPTRNIVNFKNKKNQLVNAVNHQDVGQVKALLSGPDAQGLVNSRIEGSGIALLREAALITSVAGTEIVKLLIEAGAEVNLGDSYNMTPLMMAALNGNKGTVLVLLQKGADVNAVDKSGQSALNYVSF